MTSIRKMFSQLAFLQIPKNIIAVAWPEESKAYQVLADLRSEYTDKTYQAGVAERAPDGHLVFKDGDSQIVDAGTLAGSGE